MDTGPDGSTRVPPDSGQDRVELDGRRLDVAGLVRLADARAVPAVSPRALGRVRRAWRTAGRLAVAGRLYGRGTGVGAHRSVPVEAADEAGHGLRLLRSHAGGAGPLVPAREVRAMLAVRANQLLAGGSGIHPSFVTGLVEALRLGVHPAVNEYGAVGTGDLTALAQTGLTLIGERPWLTAAPDERTAAAAPSLPGPARTPATLSPAEPATPAHLLPGGPEPAAPPATGGPPGAATLLTDGPEAAVPLPSGVMEAEVPLVAGAPGAEAPFPADAFEVAVSLLADGPEAAPSSPPAEPSSGLPAPLTLRPGDALALLSSNALALGRAALAQHETGLLLRATHAVAALSLAAVSGSPEAYAAPVHALRPYPGPARVAAETRRLLGLPDRPRGGGRRIQDPYGFRAFPQVHGAALDACERLRSVVEVEINCPSENPVLTPDGEAYHHGGFFAAPLGLALDGLNLALLQTAQLSVARLSALGRADLTGLPGFLAAGPASSSGTMILEYTANSALAELRSCAAPASAGHAVLSHGLEEAASFAGQAARQTRRADAAYATVLACELVTAVRALRLLPAPPAVPAFTAADAVLPSGTEDRPLTGDIATATEILPLLAQL